MMCQPGDFWVADIPFTNQATSKRRPVLVLWLEGLDVVVAAVTSAGPRTSSDVPLQDWQGAGLRVPSTVRLSRLDCLEQSILRFRLGYISAQDANRVKEVWSRYIKPDF